MNENPEEKSAEEVVLRKADLAFGILLAVFSLIMLFGAVRIFFNPFGRIFSQVKAQEIKNSIVNWHQSAALFPGIIAIILLFLAVLLVNFALLKGAKFDFLSMDKVHSLLRDREFRVLVTICALLCAYAFVLIPLCREFIDFFPRFQGFPFMIATFVYLVAMMLAFNKRTVRAYTLSIVISACAAGAITYGFGMLALIPLP